MRVSFVLPGHARKPGGGYRVVYTYASLLAQRGHEVVITHAAFLRPRMYLGRLYYRRELKNVLRGMADLAASARPLDWFGLDPRVETRYVPTLSPRSLPAADATIATSWRTAQPVAEAPTRVGARFYFIQHHETWDAPAARVDATWHLSLHKIVIASWLERVALDIGTDPVRRIPNAIDLQKFRLVTPIEARPDRVAMLWSSAPVKGGAVGLAALGLARKAVPTLEAALFGVGAPPDRLPKWVRYFRNPPQDVLVEEVYNRSSIYLCPSFSEGWHLPPAEAMACGCAVVSTAIDGVADYAFDGGTAMLAPVGDAEALAHRLIAMLNDKTQRVGLAERAHAEIQRFDWDRSTDLLERALIDGVAGTW